MTKNEKELIHEKLLSLQGYYTELKDFEKAKRGQATFSPLTQCKYGTRYLSLCPSWTRSSVQSKLSKVR